MDPDGQREPSDPGKHLGKAEKQPLSLHCSQPLRTTGKHWGQNKALQLTAASLHASTIYPGFTAPKHTGKEQQGWREVPVASGRLQPAGLCDVLPTQQSADRSTCQRTRCPQPSVETAWIKGTFSRTSWLSPGNSASGKCTNGPWETEHPVQGQAMADSPCRSCQQ